MMNRTGTNFETNDAVHLIFLSNKGTIIVQRQLKQVSGVNKTSTVAVRLDPIWQSDFRTSVCLNTETRKQMSNLTNRLHCCFSAKRWPVKTDATQMICFYWPFCSVYLWLTKELILIQAYQNSNESASTSHDTHSILRIRDADAIFSHPAVRSTDDADRLHSKVLASVDPLDRNYLLYGTYAPFLFGRSTSNPFRIKRELPYISLQLMNQENRPNWR